MNGYRFASAVLLTLLAPVLLSGCIAGDDAARAPHAAASTASPTAPPRLVTIGDSIMAGYGLDATEAWPEIINTTAPADVRNIACSGAGFVSIGDCGTAFGGLIAEAKQLHPEFVLIQSSSNDFGTDEAQLEEATTRTVTELHRALPDARIIGLSTIWNDDTAVPDEVATTSRALRDAVENVGGTYIDVGQPLEGHSEWLQDDDVHPTKEGQDVIAGTVRTRLDEVGVDPF